MSTQIVLIEDNHEMRDNIAEILELSNYTVYPAENGKKGVELIKQHIPDLIICDIMMPELDGYGVLKIISGNESTRHIPFIFLTAKAEKTDFRKGMNLGADDYLTKPFEDVELLEAIETRIRKHTFLQKDYSRDSEGFGEFVTAARGVQELDKLGEINDQKSYRKKEIIFREGKYPKNLYLVNSGKVKTFMINEDGKEYITGLYKTGDFIGYLSLLKDSPYAETAEALEESEICSIPKEDFNTLLYGNREVSQKFIQMLANDLEEAENRLLNLAYDSVRKRVADGLLMLDGKYNSEGNYPFTFSIPRDDLAGIVGTAKETVIRTLSDFKEEGLIGIESRRITINDRDKLKNLIY